MQEFSVESFRPYLDDGGILRSGSLDPIARSESFTVFAQRADARIDMDAWQRHAAQFFSTRIGLSADKRYQKPPMIDAALVVVVPPREESGQTRLVFGRAQTRDDLRAADDAEQITGFTGMSDLAKRCAMIWSIACTGPDDPIALLLSAIVASVVLGPILPPDGQSLYGVRTARQHLETLTTAQSIRQ